MARHLSEAEHQRIRQLADDGLSLRQIADKLGRSVGAVHRSLKPEKAEGYRDVSREKRQNLRPRMDSAERRLDVVEDQLAGLAELFNVSDAKLAEATERARRRRGGITPVAGEDDRLQHQAEEAAEMGQSTQTPKQQQRAKS